jgi:hypothetical protein
MAFDSANVRKRVPRFTPEARVASAASKIQVQGARYPEKLETLTGR